MSKDCSQHSQKHHEVADKATMLIRLQERIDYADTVVQKLKELGQPTEWAEKRAAVARLKLCKARGL